MNAPATSRPVIRESMRIGGKKVDAEGVVPVHYPYTNQVIGTVPAGTAEHAAKAFAIAAARDAGDRRDTGSDGLTFNDDRAAAALAEAAAELRAVELQVIAQDVK